MTRLFASKALMSFSVARLFVVIGMLTLAVPTILSVARDHWSSQEGTQGPIILATGAWLLWRLRATLSRDATPLTGAAWPLVLVPFALLYAFARLYRVLPLETAATYAIGVFVAFLRLGPALILRFWFPFAYLSFLIVPPVTLVAEATQPLRIWISTIAVSCLHAFGYPVAASGAIIQIGQYELLVRDACAGLGSLLTLCAVGLFYAHLRRVAGVRFGVALLIAIVPIAILANLARVLIVLLLTWYFGAAIGQGAAHEFAGLLMFIIAMAGMFAIDSMLGALAARSQVRNA